MVNHFRVAALPLSLCLISFSSSAWSQAAGSEAKTAPTEPETTAAPTTRAPEFDKSRRAALVDYGVGNVDAALSSLRELVAACEEAGSEACPDRTRADLYVALAIVLAGGKDDIKGGARLFHAALSRDPEVTVPREYATRPVQEAMREANESTNYTELAAPPPKKEEPAPEAKTRPVPATSSEDIDQDPAEAEPKRDNKTGVLLLYGMLGSGSDHRGDDVTFGAAGVLGIRFVESSGWTTAIRGRAAIVGLQQQEIVGASLLMGGSWYNPKNKRMGYILGGVGLDSHAGEGGGSVCGVGGVSLGGFLLGGGVEFGATGYSNFGMATVNVGWGGRL